MVGSLERKSRHQLMAALRSLHFLNIAKLFEVDVFLFVPGATSSQWLDPHLNSWS
jgi:hypothetical protein